MHKKPDAVAYARSFLVEWKNRLENDQGAEFSNGKGIGQQFSRSFLSLFLRYAHENWPEKLSAEFKHVIIAAVHHDYERISKAPNPIAGAEVMVQYTRAASVAKKIAAWLHQEGWEAEPVTGPMASRLAMIPAAIQAGFGELGKHGSLINPEFGSSFRLSAVLTNAPLPLDEPQTHGVDDFCSSCKICEDACPPFAITADKQLVRGIEKWYVDFDRCLPFFNEHQGCAICIAECPWSRPGVGLNLAKKLARKSLKTNDQ